MPTYTNMLKKYNSPTNTKVEDKSNQNSKESLAWFKRFAKTISPKEIKLASYHKDLLKAGADRVGRLKPGRFYSYGYTAVTPGLPYFDTFPLILALAVNGPNFYGLNFHYLPIDAAEVLFNALIRRSTPQKIILPDKIPTKWFKATIHQYRMDAIQGKIIEVPISSIGSNIFLPTARFKGTSKKAVFTDSRRKSKI